MIKINNKIFLLFASLFILLLISIYIILKDVSIRLKQHLHSDDFNRKIWWKRVYI